MSTGSASVLGGTSGQVQFDNNGIFGGMSGTSWDDTNQSLTITGAVTTSHPILDLSQTWNGSGVSFTALKLNITNTVSLTTSSIFDFQIGGASVLKLGVDSFLRLTGDNYVSGQIYLGYKIVWGDPTVAVKTSIDGQVDGNIILSDSTSAGFGRLQFGGASAAYPSLKRSTTTLQARLADDSAFTNIQGKLTTHSAYAAGTVTPTGTLTLYDSNGTAYRVPCLV